MLVVLVFVAAYVACNACLSGFCSFAPGFNLEISMKPKRVGIYGGKFDPPHVGHLICAEMTREAFNLDTVLFVTSANPPHKKTGVLDASLRHLMVQAAVAPNCHFEACDVELRRDGPSFTLDTVVELHNQYGPDTELFLMMSSEYLDPDFSWNLSKWHDVEHLYGLVTLLVFPGRDHTIEMAREWGKLLPQAKIEYLGFCPSPPVSSTLIRDRVAAGLSVWYMVLPEVWQIIRDHGLYGWDKARGADNQGPKGVLRSLGRRLGRALSSARRTIRDIFANSVG
jgi:nicotinate-nucleotide adenylyltransferase